MNHSDEFDSRVTLLNPILELRSWRGYWSEVQVYRIGNDFPLLFGHNFGVREPGSRFSYIRKSRPKHVSLRCVLVVGAELSAARRLH
jgi:hypothetical protein